MFEDNQLTSDQLQAGSSAPSEEAGVSAVADHPHAGAPEGGWSVPTPTAATPNAFAELVVKRGGAETELRFPISPPAVIGRFDPGVGPIDVDLGTLPEGAYVSRKHAKIIFENGVWKVQDLGSSNGTFILKGDFERCEECEITDGTEIALGNARFVFHLTSAEGICDVSDVSAPATEPPAPQS